MGAGVGRAIIESLRALDMTLRIKVTVNMTTLAVIRNDAIALVGCELPPQRIIKGFGMTGREAQERTQRAKKKPVLHRNAS